MVTVDDLLDEDLFIPPYQRRYSWEPATAEQLLDDIEQALRAQNGVVDPDEARGRSYVLGAVILHWDEELEQLHVVDGQQRLLTLNMLLRLLDAQADGSNAEISPEEENPRAPVVRVRKALDRRVQHDEFEPAQLADFIRSSCELIRVETDDRDEAFRVFDSQNYRGKALLPHDLLKAYHLREMRGETKSMKLAVVAGWEAVSDPELDRLFSTYLWRIKRWSRGQSAVPEFAARNIDTFKGVTPDARSPVARYHLAAQAAVPMFSAWDGQSEDAQRIRRIRFQLDAPVQAGRPFFEMVGFMLEELGRLRKVGFQEDWEQFASTDHKFQEVTSQAARRYRFVSELYLAALLYYTNKFGDEHLTDARQRLFTWAYSLRTRFERIYFRTVNNHAKEPPTDGSAFLLLRDAETASELRRLVIDVEGRDEQHEQDLLRILTDLAG